MRCRAHRNLALLALLVASGGCRPRQVQTEQVDHKYLTIDPGKVIVQSGEVGAPPRNQPASYVLADVKNSYPEDLMVTLGGALQDSGGRTVGRLRLQSIRVPGAGGVRLFALVDDRNALRPDAHGARLEIVSAYPVTYRAEVVVTDGRVTTDQGRAVVMGNVENRTDREAATVVVAGFYDAAGKPLGRSSTDFRLAARGKRGVQFVGPTGSTRAYLFIGESVF